MKRTVLTLFTIVLFLQAARDPDRTLSLSAQSCMFELLSSTLDHGQTQASNMYRTLVFLLIEKHAAEKAGAKCLLVENMARFLEKNTWVPVDCLVDPFLR
jgi:hypothetical protein